MLVCIREALWCKLNDKKLKKWRISNNTIIIGVFEIYHTHTHTHTHTLTHTNTHIYIHTHTTGADLECKKSGDQFL